MRKITPYYYILILCCTVYISACTLEQDPTGIALYGLATAGNYSDCNSNHQLEGTIYEDVQFRVIIKNSSNVLLKDVPVLVRARKKDCAGYIKSVFEKELITSESGTVNGSFNMEYIYDTDVGEWDVRVPSFFIIGNVERFTYGDQFLQTTIVVKPLED